MTQTLKLIIATFLVLNAMSFMLYGIDKYKAIHHEWRIPEKTLLTASFFAPFGAGLGMTIFHHKTRKLKFTLSTSIFVLLQIGCLIYWGTR